MKVLMHETALKELLEKVVSVIGRNLSLSALECVKLQVKPDSVRATASNLNTWLLAQAECQADEEGVIVVPGKKLSEIVKLLPREEMALEVNERQLAVKCQGSRFKLSLISEKDYPKEQCLLGRDGFIEIPRERFQSALGAISFATAKQEYLKAICGILFEFKKDKLVLVATDGHRLAKISIPVESENEQKIIVPSDIVRYILKMKGKTVRIFVNESTVGLYGKNLGVTSRLLEGKYPDYESVIPQDSDKILIVNIRELIQGLKQVEVFAQDVNEIAKLTILKNANELSLESAGEGFKSEVKVGCECSGDEIEIGFNAKYLLELLSVIKSEQVKWTFKDPMSAMILKPVDKETDELYLLMPIRLE
ncbi:DNA polymerase III subunit beta [candidate division WOR-3 bacterium]|nr:DNA polymerase III subunit beta [candidate division WOR-3 bacterium]